MSIERWGAFSVVDHMDARKLAADVLLYDRLVLPKPPDWDRERWVKRKWEPEGLDRRLAQLGDAAIPATWDLDRQKQWQEKFRALREDARDMNAALHMTRRVLAEHGRDYRAPGVAAVEVIAAYQSEADFSELDASGSLGAAGSELDFLIAQRLAVPEDDDPEDALKRALELRGDNTFIRRRRRFHHWQRQILSTGILPEDAARELVQLVSEYNDAVRKAKGVFRVETVMLVGGLSVAALAALGGVAPALVGSIGIGALKGAQVVSIGNAAVGAVLQITRHVRGRKDPDAGAGDFSAAMFHQIEEDLGWRLRADPGSSADSSLGHPTRTGPDVTIV
jgi:hypothetical protein